MNCGNKNCGFDIEQKFDSDGFVEEWGIASALAMEILQSYTKAFIWWIWNLFIG